MEVGNDLSTTLVTETPCGQRHNCPLASTTLDSSADRYPTYRDLRAPEVPEGGAQFQEADHTGEEYPDR
jgi:hypothetical protein